MLNNNTYRCEDPCSRLGETKYPSFRKRGRRRSNEAKAMPHVDEFPPVAQRRGRDTELIEESRMRLERFGCRTSNFLSRKHVV